MVRRVGPSFFSQVAVLALFFLSGALGLIYEVAWSRMMMHVFGSTALAVGTVLAAFMSGLALGAWLVGRVADRSPNPLRLYAWLELGIALAALVSHYFLARLGPAHLALYELAGSSATLFAVVRFLLAFVLILGPTLLMGATLPVLTRFLDQRESRVGLNLSTLYAVNTFGAVGGVLLTGFFLIGIYGIHVPVYLAATGNFLIAGIAWLVSRISAQRPLRDKDEMGLPSDMRPDTANAPGRGTLRLITIGLGVSGFTSFAYEIYWTRSLVFILGNSVYAFSTMLSAFLSGIALGGWLVRFVMPRLQDRVALFGWIQVLIGTLSALALPLLFALGDLQSLNEYLIRTSDSAVPLVLAGFALSFLVMLIPATLIGATFPLAGHICVRNRGETGAAVGRLYAVNTLGNVVGALAPGVILLAWLGIQKGILAMATLNLLIGFAVLIPRLFQKGRHPAWRVAVPALLVFSALVMSRAPLQFQFPSEGEQDDFQTLFYREGSLATTKVYLDPVSGEKYMSVDGIVIGGTGYTEFKQLLLAHLPKLLVADFSSELSVGIGSGILLGESALHRGVQEITGVEIEPSVVEGAVWFREENHDVLNNPKLRVVHDDIGNYLRITPQRFRVISADEKTADEYASNGFSYSKEYYDLLREHLAPGGLVVQWVPSTLPPSQYRMVLNTFLHSFAHVQLWYFLPAHKRGPFNSLLIGSSETVAIDPERIDRRLREHPDAFNSLVPYGLTSAEAILPHFIADEHTLRPAVEGAPINRFEHPRYEFFPPWAYAHERQQQVQENHGFIIELKRTAHGDYLRRIDLGYLDSGRLRRTFVAEFRYLRAFQKFLGGLSLDDHYRLFDDALGVAPWNDSLRARVYAQYAYLASTRSNPAEHAGLMKRANELYQGRQ